MQTFLYLYVTDSLCQFFGVLHFTSLPLCNLSRTHSHQLWWMCQQDKTANQPLWCLSFSVEKTRWWAFSSVCRVFPSKFLKRWKGCSNSPVQLIAAYGNTDLQHFALTLEITPIVRRAVVLPQERFIAAPTSGIPLQNVQEWGQYRLHFFL